MKKYIAIPRPEGSFYLIFCEKIVFHLIPHFDETPVKTLLARTGCSALAGIFMYTRHNFDQGYDGKENKNRQ